MREVARQLVCPVAAGEPVTSQASVEAFRKALDPLQTRLAPLVGKEGFRALLGRAVALAKCEFPWLATLEVGPDGLLPGLEVISAGGDPSEVQAGCVAVLAGFLTLLVGFIGSELTRQLVSGAWADLPVQDLDFGAQEGDV